MRWADLDLLGHVNNVVYIDYLQEARVDLIRTMLGPRSDERSDLAEGVVVVRHEVTYLAPMGLRFRAVKIECWVTEIRAATFTMAYEVFHEGDDGTRQVYLRAVTVLTPYVFAQERPRRISATERAALSEYLEETAPRQRPTRIAVDRDRAAHYALHVRFSDVDVYRHVNNVKYFEYLQESRIRMIGDITRGQDVARPHFVVAQTDVDYRAAILHRRTPYDLYSQIVRVGDRSMTVDSEIADEERTLARARVTVVFFDDATQRSVAPSPELHALLTSHVASGVTNPSAG